MESLDSRIRFILFRRKIRGFASTCFCVWCFPRGSDGKESICNAEDPGSIPVSGRSPGEGFVFVFG